MASLAVSTPTRSLEQRLAALERANVIRSHRARLKKDVRAGRKHATVAFSDPLCETMKVWDLLLCVPKVGRAKLTRAFWRIQMSTSKTIGGLSERQRTELMAEMALWV